MLWVLLLWIWQTLDTLQLSKQKKLWCYFESGHFTQSYASETTEKWRVFGPRKDWNSAVSLPSDMKNLCPSQVWMSFLQLKGWTSTLFPRIVSGGPPFRRWIRDLLWIFFWINHVTVALLVLRTQSVCSKWGALSKSNSPSSFPLKLAIKMRSQSPKSSPVCQAAMWFYAALLQDLNHSKSLWPLPWFSKSRYVKPKFFWDLWRPHMAKLSVI